MVIKQKLLLRALCLQRHPLCPTSVVARCGIKCIEYSGSTFCLTGGEALQVSTTAAHRAAEEARSGKWLEELESGGLLRAVAPGMERGAFGAWAVGGAKGQDLLILPIKEGFQGH